MCIIEGCKTRPCFAFEGQNAEYCVVHKKDCMVNVKLKTCKDCKLKTCKDCKLNALSSQIDYWTNQDNKTKKTIEII